MVDADLLIRVLEVALDPPAQLSGEAPDEISWAPSTRSCRPCRATLGEVLTLTGLVSPSRRSSLVLRARPLQGFSGNGAVPSAQTCRVLHTDNIGQAELVDPTAESRVVAAAGIGKHDSFGTPSSIACPICSSAISD
jgi:hypothetical protein